MKTITYTVSDERAEAMRRDLLSAIRFMQGDLKRAEDKQRMADEKAASAAANVAEWKADIAEKVAQYESAFGPLPAPEPENPGIVDHSAQAVQ